MDTQSPEIKQLMTALSEMHKKHGVIIDKDKRGHKGTYAGLSQTLKVIHEMTREYGLILTQASRIMDNSNVIETMLFHTPSGQFIRSHSYLTPAESVSPDQSWGGSTTYHKRYDAMSLCGLFADDDTTDNDGWTDRAKAAVDTKAKAVIENKAKFNPPLEGKKPMEGPSTENQIKALKAKLRPDTLQDLLERYGIETLDQLTKQEASDEIAARGK